MSKVVKIYEDPTLENTIIKDEQIAPVKMIYAKVSTLAKMFNISRNTVYRFLADAEEMEEFKNKICVDVSSNLTLVHIETFEAFLRTCHKKYL